jgi:hypothetical protein
MAESFLKEQLERIRKLTERISKLENSAAELSDAMAHDREALKQGPLHEVRDFRLYSDVNAANTPKTGKEADVGNAPSEADDAPERPPSGIRDSARRRRRS